MQMVIKAFVRQETSDILQDCSGCLILKLKGRVHSGMDRKLKDKWERS